MEFITWQESMSVGIPMIDQDHKTIMKLINFSHQQIKDDHKDKILSSALNALIDYTLYHFTREEKLMADNNYPGLEDHKLQHQVMIDEIKRLETKYNEQGHEAFEEVSQFLSDWLIKHINGTDKQYTKHLNDCGIY